MMIARAYIAKYFAALLAVAVSFCLRAASFEAASNLELERLKVARGGDSVRKIDNGDGTYDIVHIFTNAAKAATFTVPENSDILASSGRYLVVGGGGSGGADCGGGGGAGGFVTNGFAVIAGDYAVVVGAGGARALYDGAGGGGSSVPGVRGGDSSISFGGSALVVANGGGGGGSWADSTASTTTNSGQSGGSGGGVSGRYGSIGKGTQPGSAYVGLGNNGAIGVGTDRGGGGGGAGGVGLAAVGDAGGNGGVGVSHDITGEVVVYAAGGGGFGSTVTGLGGGDASTAYGNAGDSASDGHDGAPNTGSGGGAGGSSPHRRSGAGADGIVVFRYTVASRPSVSEVGALVTEVDGEKVYSFTDTTKDGLFQLTGYARADILLVGGGGAGGSGRAGSNDGVGGGGGAGRMIETNCVILPLGTYIVQVGAGGENLSTAVDDVNLGANGAPSKLVQGGEFIYQALGGGGGGIKSGGCSGGSGGGGSFLTSNRLGGDAIDDFGGFGFDGGRGLVKRAGAGGGGAGSPGGDAAEMNVGGIGGSGRISAITGEHVVYAAGGGGGSRTGTTGGEGGSGIGGNGGYGSTAVAATAGLDGTGSGGGGGRNAGLGGSGGSGIVIVRIKKMMPYAPADTSFEYDGKEHTLLISSGDGSYAIYDAEGNSTDRISVREVGTHRFTLERSSEYECWSDGRKETRIECVVTVTKPKLVINSLKLEGWQIGQKKSSVQIDSVPELAVGDYSLLYSRDGADGSWSEELPLMPGEYYVTLDIKESQNFEMPDFIPTVRFALWAWDDNEAHIPELGYHARFTVDYSGEPLVDFPMLVKVSEESLLGFKYEHMNDDASDLRFIDETGKLLPHEIDTWNPDGESYIWVKVPDYRKGSAVTACWGELAGKTPPKALDSSDVWSSFAGVWHMSESISTAEAGTYHSKDSTLTKNDAVPQKGSKGDLTQMVSTAGVVGFGRVNSTVASTANGNRLSTKMGYNTLGSQFTFSGWYYMNARGGYPRLVGNIVGNNPPGWSIETGSSSSTTLYFRPNGSSTSAAIDIGADLCDGWTYLTFVYDGTRASLYSNGVLQGSVTVTSVNNTTSSLAFGANSDGSEYSLNGGYDELRLSQGVKSVAWIKAEYDQVKSSMYTLTPVKIAPGACFVNRWIEMPSINKTAWKYGETNDVFVVEGKTVYGESYYLFKPLAGAPVREQLPMRAGEYEFIGQADAGSDGDGAKSWASLSTNIAQIMISISSPYGDLSGKSGNSTLSGRVLLANDFDDGKISVINQSYWNTNKFNDVYWIHEGVSKIPFQGYLNKTTMSDLVANGTLAEICLSKVIWHLKDIHIGCTYYTLGDPMVIDENYLPWSQYAKPATSSNGEVGAQFESSHLVMRNSLESAIYSPCYTNGVGTIYFDAVNASVSDDGENTKLVVEICTNTVSAISQIPTDENVMKLSVDESTSALVTNRFGNAIWHKVELMPLVKDGTTDFVVAEKTDELALAINKGGSYENFYRVCAKVDYRGPIRFRIRRASVASNYGLQAKYILVDNVIVSYPPMSADLTPYGEYNPNIGGKHVLGNALTWDVPFPSMSDNILGRAKISYETNDAIENPDVSNFVISAKMHYRWRYLEQEIGQWKYVGLDSANNFSAEVPLELPVGRVGDVEYWFEMALNAPFYEYYDYSGANLGLSGLYSENISVVTNRSKEYYYDESMGSDWFVRLREGKSDYESIRLIAVTETEKYEGVFVATNVVDMHVTADNVWRGYLKTPEALPKGVKYRFEALNKQTHGSMEWVTNRVCWRASIDADMLPVSDILVDSSEEEWSTVPCDGVTGYILFQIEDSTKALTVVHADYQDFNGWNDAKKGRVFVGSSTSDDSIEKVGASAKAKEYLQTFDNWTNMAKVNDHWRESFATTTQLNVKEYEAFDSILTPNGWTAGQGMYVYGKYKDGSETTQVGGMTDRALQMQGQGVGYIQYVDGAESPRGLESVSFNGRLAQFINFSDFAYYDAPTKVTMSNYTFAAAGAFDIKQNTSFSGNASLSLVAYHRPGKGCYEFRIEQVKAKKSGNSFTYDPKGQVASLYRWNYDASGRITATLLGSIAVSDFSTKYDWPTCSSLTNKGYQPLYISVANSPTGTCIVAGYKLISASDTSMGGPVAPGFANSEISGKKYNSICYRDTSDLRLTSGTYGMLSSNSEGFMITPRVFNSPVSQTSSIRTANKVDRFTAQAVTFDTTSFADLSSQIRDELWYSPPGRMIVTNATTIYGFKNVVPQQTLNIYAATAGKTDWTLLSSETFSSFGTLASPKVVKLYTTADCSVKIAPGGTIEDIRTDVVIDDIVLTQFRGDSWENGKEMVKYIPSWQSEQEYKGLTNFIFTTAWIEDKSILLSARRTTPSLPASIRTPLLDGNYNRGVGLGMFSFNYRNAHRNVKLLLQIATNNVDYTVINNINNFDSSIWTTVTNYDFSAKTPNGSYVLPPNGNCSTYLGLHGVKGAIRLVMDPKVVERVATETDITKFGDIYITDVFCRDEPVLDMSSWWGWNLRTLGGDLDGEKRMLISDMYSLVRDETVATNVLVRGLSLALNNSATVDVEPLKGEAYKAHQPFVQTPTFTSNLVGEVSFKARKYDTLNAQPAQVTLYGSKSGKVDDTWVLLNKFVISNSTYNTYSYKTDPSPDSAYCAFRLAVTGVDGINDTNVENPKPEGGYASPVRVLIDEVAVSEAVRARVAFRNVGAFRTGLDGTGWVAGVPSIEQQPLCNESWGIQCEIFAAQLADEIDFTRTPSVKLHWFPGTTPWGYHNWKGSPRAKSAFLAPATGTNMIYRSSYTTAKDAVVDASIEPGSVVQYELEVIYYQIGSATPVTNYLSAAGSWATPSWYKPVDYNLGKSAFSAYNILDTVAPKWAWINEVNIFGLFDNNYENTDKDLQFIEVAVPAEADISGWSVRVLEAQPGNNLVVTNTIGRFGSADLAATKPNLLGMASNMVFRVLGNTLSRQNQRLQYADGTLDGIWKVDYPTTEITASEINAIEPFGIQLVRGSGIVEHEIVVLGTNWWSRYPAYAAEMHPSNTVNALNRMMPSADFVYVGDDDAGQGCSLSVMGSRGQVSNDWFRAVAMTPGRINDGQVIDPDHPTPNGSSIVIYANLDATLGHIYQTLGEAVATNMNQILVIQKGSQRGTNITYTVDPWYELGTVTTNGRPAVATKLSAPRTYQLTVGVNASNNVTVVASAKINSELERTYDLGVNNKYRNAIMKWLEGGKDAYGKAWANPYADEIRLAEFRSLHGSVVTNMTLTQMYWLDMDPTVGDLALVAGMASAPLPEIKPGYAGSEAVTNLKMGVKMYITNTTEDVSSPYYAKPAYAPYTLRGLEPGSLSKDLSSDVAWTSVTFKVTGILANGFTSESNENNWVPLRWFVFGENSFDSDFVSRIEVKDPFGTDSPGYGAGWSEWVEKNGATPVFFKWAIDSRLKPFTVELLKEENYYDN